MTKKSLRNRAIIKERIAELNYRCEDCKKKINKDILDWHIHHKILKSMGGTNELKNLKILCKECHLKAHHYKKKIKTNRNKIKKLLKKQEQKK